MADDTPQKDLRFYSWNRQLARKALKPFVGSRLTPNHITALRWALGFLSCYAFANGDLIMGGLVWTISAFLDRCDGEFARMTGQTSRVGYLFDLYGDIVFNALVFAALGWGLRADPPMLMDLSWVAMGLIAGLGVLIAAVLAELNEQGMAQGEKTFSGIWGFDFDDFIYLIGILPMLGLAPVMLIGAAIFGPIAAVTVGLKLVFKPGPG